MLKEIEKCLQEDGSLFSLGWYLEWAPGNEEAVLDGQFTAEQLRGIADYMEGKDA